MKRRLWILASVVAIAATATMLLIGVAGAADQKTSRVRVAHAIPIPSGLKVDIAVDGTPVYTQVTYKTVTDYTVWPAGFHTVTADAGITTLEETVYLTGGIDATVIGVGTGFGVEAIGLEDDNRYANANAVRVVHLAPNTAAMDVTLTGTVGTDEILGLPYKEASDYLGGLGAGELTIEVRAAGTVKALDPQTATLQSEAIHTLFIMGAGDTLDLVAVVDQAYGYRAYLPLIARAGAGD